MSIWALTLEGQASRSEAVLSYALLYTSRRELVWEICSKSIRQLLPLMIPLLRSLEPKRTIVRGGGLACSVALNARLNHLPCRVHANSAQPR